MRRVVLSVVFLLPFLSLNAQYRYKIETRLDYQGTEYWTDYDIKFGGYKIFDYNSTLRRGILENNIRFENQTIPLVQGETYFFEQIKEYDNQINSYNISVDTRDPSNPGAPIEDCTGEQNADYPGNGGGINLIFFNFRNPSCYDLDPGSGNLTAVLLDKLVDINDAGSSEYCIEKKLPLKITKHDVVFSFSLGYALDDNIWVELLPYQRRTSHMDIDLSQINKIDESNNIKIGVKYLENENNYSNLIIYPVVSCSPQLKSFTRKDTKCSYTDDGSFSMILDRDLPAGKKLVASLFFENAFNLGEYNLLDQKDTDTLIDNGDTTYTYNWPSDTPILPGKYKVRYQSYDTIAPNPKWDSLEGTEKGFTIGSPDPLFFGAETANDVYCKGGSDGAIKVDAYGGVGKYRYLLNSTTDTILFTNTNKGTVNARINHTIKNLPKGTKKIKVQDGNGCTEKN